MGFIALEELQMNVYKQTLLTTRLDDDKLMLLPLD